MVETAHLFFTILFLQWFNLSAPTQSVKTSHIAPPKCKEVVVEAMNSISSQKAISNSFIPNHSKQNAKMGGIWAPSVIFNLTGYTEGDTCKMNSRALPIKDISSNGQKQRASGWNPLKNFGLSSKNFCSSVLHPKSLQDTEREQPLDFTWNMYTLLHSKNHAAVQLGCCNKIP